MSKIRESEPYKAALLKIQKLHDEIDQIPTGVLRDNIRHTAEKLWMFLSTAIDEHHCEAEAEAEAKQWAAHAARFQQERDADRAWAERLQAKLDNPAPIPMLLTCPACGERHVDQGEFATKPHHTHACQHCGMCWRPAVVATVGVRFLPGFKDEVKP